MLCEVIGAPTLAFRALILLKSRAIQYKSDASYPSLHFSIDIARRIFAKSAQRGNVSFSEIAEPDGLDGIIKLHSDEVILIIIEFAAVKPVILITNGMVKSEIISRVFRVTTGTVSGTAFTMECGNRQFLVTAKHLFENAAFPSQATISLLTGRGYQKYCVDIRYPHSPSVDIAVLMLNPYHGHCRCHFRISSQQRGDP